MRLVLALLACASVAHADPRALSFSLDGVDRTPREVSVPIEVPAGMHVVAMAITIDGERMRARPMSPDVAREKYERIVEHRRDPALLEDAGGGRVRVRVFPLVRGHAATITLSIESDHAPIFDDPIRVDDATSLLAYLPGEDRVPSVVIAAPDPPYRDAGLSPSEIRGTIRLHEAELRHCYELATLRDHALAGTASLHFVIGPDGRVNAPSIDGSISDEAALACMHDALAAWQFRAGAGYVQVNYPITFQRATR
ncbi:MAG TPA: AgmX/PglI C-terminal domain-containing protein [Kofleriaceae bacterium]|jgi:hypothetical protein|nr:AgmX/PglI C-terminal domain-containing protein [Kofleriaceae bacterium]